MHSIIKFLKWAPFRECLVASPTTIFILSSELKTPLPHPRVLRHTHSHSNWSHCHRLHQQHPPSIGVCVCDTGPGLGTGDLRGPALLNHDMESSPIWLLMCEAVAQNSHDPDLGTLISGSPESLTESKNLLHQSLASVTIGNVSSLLS